MDNSNIQNYVLGAGAGYLTYKGAKSACSKMSQPYKRLFAQQYQNLSLNDKQAIQKAVQKTWVDSGLKANKIYLHDVNPQNAVQIQKLMGRKSTAYVRSLLDKRMRNEDEAAKILDSIRTHLRNKEYKKAWQEYKKIFKGFSPKAKAANIIDVQSFSSNAMSGAKTPLLKFAKLRKFLRIFKPDKKDKFGKVFKSVIDGKNAFFNPLTRDIMINLDKLAGSAFHEMGHALNATGKSKSIRALAFVRHATPSLVPLFLAVGLLKNKKAEGEKAHGFFDKVTTFIKNHAGILTFGAMVPTLTEEGLASIRGGKLAKKALSPELLKTVNKTNVLAWGTYLISALTLTAAVKAGIAVRDKIAQK